jgi:hypothetical protein
MTVENNQTNRDAVDTPNTHQPFRDPIDAFVSEASDDGNHWIVRALHHSAYDKGEAELPSTFVCECDYKEVADALARILNNQL